MFRFHSAWFSLRDPCFGLFVRYDFRFSSVTYALSDCFCVLAISWSALPPSRPPACLSPYLPACLYCVVLCYPLRVEYECGVLFSADVVRLVRG